MSGKSPLGFTIIETLIFLAVSGALLAAAINFIGDKVDNTEFNQGINQFVSNLRSEVNQVSTGTFDSNNDIQCTQTGESTIQISTGKSNQGSNMGCQYLGEVVQFNVNGNPSQYAIYPVASNQYSSLNPLEPITDLSQMTPCAIYSSGVCSSVSNTQTDASTVYTIPYGIKVATATYGMWAYYLLTSGGNVASCDGTGSSVPNGGLTTDLVPITSDLSPGYSQSSAVGIIDQAFCSQTTPYGISSSEINQSIQLCVESGNQYATITFGGEDPTSIDLQIRGTAC